MKALEIIIFVIIGIVLIFIGFSLFPQASALVKGVLGFGGFLSDEDIEVQAQSMLKSFVSEYAACKVSADSNCLCPFSSYSLPKGAFLEITNTPGSKFTSFKMFRGEVVGAQEVQYGDLLSGGPQRNIDAKANPFLENDLVMIATKSPNRVTSYVTDDGKFDLASYVQETKIFVQAADNPGDGGTPLDVFSSVDYNLQGLYKVDDTRMALVPSPDASLNTVGNPNAEELAKLRKVDRCVLIPNEIQQVVVDVKKELENCRASKRIAPFACQPFQVSLPDKYEIRFDEKQVFLWNTEKEKVAMRAALSYTVCNSPVYKDEDLPNLVPANRADLKLTSTNKYAAVITLPKEEVCMHVFSESEILEGKIESLRAALASE